MSNDAWRQAIHYHQQGNIRAAQPLYLQVLRQHPEHPQALRNLGLIALQTGHIDDAAQLYQRALRVKPDVADWQSELAQVYSRAGDAAAARQRLLNAIRLAPDNSLFHYLLGNLYSDMGRMEEAIDSYRTSLRLNPAQGRVYSNLAHLAATGDYQFSDAELTQLQRQSERRDLDDENRSHLHFALANVAHGRKDYAAAFPHFVTANQLKKQATAEWQRFKPAEQDEQLRQLQAVFTAEFIEQHRDYGIASEIPVFIVGMPRTGTTLVERILAGHPQVVGRGELMHIKTIARDSMRLETGTEFPECLRQISAASVSNLARQYISRITQRDQQALRIVDKMPTNYQLLGVIHLLFPNARIIHTTRDPMDTVWSCFSRNIAARFTNDLDDLVICYRQYRQYMDFWRQVLPLRMLDFSYEDLVEQFEQQARRLIGFLDLEWHDDCLRYDRQQAQIGTASKMQVRKPIYRSAVHAWQKYAEQLAPLREKMAEFYP
ncbi:MAG: sulfotransferase [Wenzhouxiangellaceae bacterium]